MGWRLRHGGRVELHVGTSTLTDSILYGNGDDIDVSGTPITVSYCSIGDGDYAGSNGNITGDPQFVSGLVHGYYLSQTAAGQGSDSPCVDAGSDTAANLGLDEVTTRTDGVDDAGQVDMGYHAEYPLMITDVYYDHATTSVSITFTSEASVDYVLEVADAAEYSDAVVWSDRPSTGAVGAVTTVTDNLSTNPLGNDHRFYRVKRADESETSWQTAGVFELDLAIQWTMWDFFISTPLIPDPDHASVQDVLGTQINRSGPVIMRLAPATGVIDRMQYSQGAQTWSVLYGSSFELEPCIGYYLSCGGGLQETLPLRLTGYVPEEALSTEVSKPGWTTEDRWLAYSMPRATTLETCGLRQSVTGWELDNRVRLRPHGAAVWSTYKWTGVQWEDLANPGVGVDPPLVCGSAIQFTRKGMPPPTGPEDYWPQATWYAHPPNNW